MGPCYHFTPIRVSFRPSWTVSDLLQSVQAQSAASFARGFVWFEKTARECVNWKEKRFFDSIVHHQDWEDFDEMEFAGGKCKVDITNPSLPRNLLTIGKS